MTVTSPEPSSLQSPRRHHSWNITPCSAIWKTRFIMNIIILIIFVIFKFIMHVWNNNYLNFTISISDVRFTNDTGSPLKHQFISRIALSVSNCPDCIFSSIPDFHQEFSEYWPRDGSWKPRLIVLTAVHHAGKRMTSFIFEGVITKSVSIRSMFSLVKGMRLKCVILKRW